MDNAVSTTKFLLDPYMDWVKGEGIPIVEDFGVDLLAVQTEFWPRFGANGAAVHMKGRGDFMSMFVIDLPAAGKTAPQKHLFEEVIYVLEGHGSTTVEDAVGRKHTFEWGPKSLFALPLNAKYQHFNGSGSETARFCSATNLPLIFNIFHNEGFIFQNPYAFPERTGEGRFFSGEGEFLPVRPGRHMWETNFVPDLTRFELKAWEGRGAGSSNIAFILADGTMHAHMSGIPSARYKKGHRHGDGMHVFAVTGSGYSLFWYEGEQDFKHVPWRHGVMYAPPLLMFHQHFNTAPEPARYLAIGIGSRRYPFIAMRREAVEGAEMSTKDGGWQIEYADQDPRIHELWLKEIAAIGGVSDMGKFIDETAYKSTTAK